MSTKILGLCTRCAMPANALIHTGTANNHAYTPAPSAKPAKPAKAAPVVAAPKFASVNDALAHVIGKHLDAAGIDALGLAKIVNAYESDTLNLLAGRAMWDVEQLMRVAERLGIRAGELTDAAVALISNEAVVTEPEPEISPERAQIEAVREIHAPIDAAMYGPRNVHKVQVCTGCGQDDGNWQRWPCPTVEALGGAVGGELA